MMYSRQTPQVSQVLGWQGGGKDTEWPSPMGPLHRLGPLEQGLPWFGLPDIPVLHLTSCEIWKRAPLWVSER